MKRNIRRGRYPSRRGGVLVWVLIVVVLGVGVMMLLPSMCRSSESGNRVKCASNLHQIGLAILLYQQDHGGAYPASFAEMAAEEQITNEVFVCPSSNAERLPATQPADVAAAFAADDPPKNRNLSYVYAGRGLTDKTVRPDQIVAYEPLANHDDTGGCLLYGDGHAEFADAKHWPATAKAGGLSDAAIAKATARAGR